MSVDCRVKALCERLDTEANSPIKRYTPAGADPDAVIDVRAVFQQHHHSFETTSIHPILAPKKGRYGLRDYEKVFCVDHLTGPDIFDMRGISRDGCIIIVRPDQYVADVLPLDNYEGLCRFFEPLLLDA